MTTAKFVKEITVTDPDSKGLVKITIFKHENGGMFGVDASLLMDLDQCFEVDEDLLIQDPLNEEGKVILIGL